MRYFLGFLVAIVLIIFVIMLIFRGGGDPKQVPATKKPLQSYAATNAQTIMTVDGPTNANQEHRQVRITVDRSNSTYEEIQGYDGAVTRTEHFPNTQSSYENFLLALTRAGFTKGSTDKALSDERGYCATGQRYVYEIIQDGKSIQRYWATTCGNPKTYLGNQGLTRNLFEDQIPDYSQLAQDAF